MVVIKIEVRKTHGFIILKEYSSVASLKCHSWTTSHACNRVVDPRAVLQNEQDCYAISTVLVYPSPTVWSNMMKWGRAPLCACQFARQETRCCFFRHTRMIDGASSAAFFTSRTAQIHSRALVGNGQANIKVRNLHNTAVHIHKKFQSIGAFVLENT